MESSLPVSSLFRLKTATYMPVSSTALLIYDYIITLIDEIRLVWWAPWSIGKALFLLTRYPVLVNNCLELYRNVAPTVPQCKHLDSESGYVSIVGIMVAEIILVIRVWALWERNWKMGAFLATLVLTGLIVAVVAVSRYFSTTQLYVAPPELKNALPGCHDFGTNTSSFIPYVVLMAFETVIFILMFVKGLKHYKGLSQSKFLYGFYQDGIIYYAFLLVVSIINIIVLSREPPEYVNLLISVQRSLHSMLSARILLHLRHESEYSRRTGLSTAGHGPIGSLAFRHSSAAEQEESVIATRRWNIDDGTWFGYGTQVGRAQPERDEEEEDDLSSS
ncbi:hypothetical protein HGRIS_008743 [Hohenbuehelia grisea]|uniref:DUF6533 domain-containing protein n=1 Tax=Hohenbuehelia grisea TaxID=104357 RepID=A0ABR3J8U5_9AGAR